MLEDDIFHPNFVFLLLLLIILSQFLLKEDRSQDFKRLALRLQPERIQQGPKTSNVFDRDDVRQAFAVVAEAYEVLSDPLRKAVYDQYGEQGLKQPVRGPDGCIEPYIYHGEPKRTYREFFGTENPYADLLDNLGNPLLPECPETGIKKKDKDVIKTLPLSLKEVFYGGIKKMKIQRLVLTGEGADSNKGTTTLEEKVLSIPIMPGMPAGAKIVFPEEGDQGPTKIPADIVFVTEDRLHEKFKREGSNLRMTVNIFLADALTGTIITVRTIDDRILRVPITSVITPDYTKTVVGEGLPKVEAPDKRGDLIIDFLVEFPSYLSPTSKRYVQLAFEDQSEEEESYKPSHRMFLDGKMYTRADKLSEMCRH